jgi:putative nucleotidyltransferase with HDIG domain
MVLPFRGPNRVELIATAELDCLVEAGPRAIQEKARLQKWAQRVCDHLSAKEPKPRPAGEDLAGQGKNAWEALLALDQVIRRFRFHKNPSQQQQRILEAAFPLLGVQALVWVPHDAATPVLVQGEEVVAAPAYRELAGTLLQNQEVPLSGLLLSNGALEQKSWGSRFPQIANLMAFPVQDQTVIGWMLAINKIGSGQACDVAFRRSDAALLTAFVSLFALHLRGSNRYQDLKNMLVELLCSLTSAHDARDARTYGHSERVARIAVELGRELGLAKTELSDVYLAGLLHDIGKVGINDSLVEAQELVSSEEGDLVKRHVTIGYSILANLPPFRHLLPAVLYHHEHYDGSGFPEGLTGDAIPLMARLLAVAEAYDELSTGDADHAPLPCRQVEEAIVAGGGSHWDQRVVDAFLRCRHKIHAIRQRGIGESLRLAIDGTLHKDGSSRIRLQPMLAQASGQKRETPC